MNVEGWSGPAEDRTSTEDGGPLTEYQRKRDFSRTGEPVAPKTRPSREVASSLRYVIQKHAARRLHYDFRLELDGTLKSWAVPKGPSLDPQVRRMAVHVEDHPLDYAGFEGHIPEGQYGGGDVIVWDRGVWEPVDPDPAKAYASGKLSFRLDGEKLRGAWTLVRTRRGEAGKEQWLLIKADDAFARAADEYDLLEARPESVLTGQTLPAPGKKHAKAVPRTAAAALPHDTDLHGTLAPIPAWIAPQLATAVDAPPAGEWHYELKFDGYRMLARVDDGAVQIFSRNRKDWTATLQALQEALGSLPVRSAWLDGEIVVTDKDGIPDFQALQNSLETGRTDALRYFLFDLPYMDGEDLRDRPLEVRRERLKRLLDGNKDPRLSYSEDFDVAPSGILAAACAMRIEGVMGKRAGSAYRSGRSTDWIKLKCRQRQEFVIVGFTLPQGGREGFGSLLLAVREDGHAGKSALRYAGRVGSGFSGTSLHTLHKRMQAHVVDRPPLVVPRSVKTGVTWVEPALVCEVAFAEWTRDGLVRHSVFLGLREDKPVAEAVREIPLSHRKVEGRSAGSRATPGVVAGRTITNARRVIDESSGVTKGELAAFYCRIAPYLLSHLKGRPLSIVRAPEGIAGERFFQRHATQRTIPGVTLLPRELDPDGERLIQVDSLDGLIGAAQMGTIEFHTWNATSSRIEQPDRLVFDLDPDPALPWARMVEATRVVVALLDELGLQSFLKTSGGKGMHVVVPLMRRHGWDELKEFSRAVTLHLARLLPQRFADRMGPQNRIGKIFVDYLRNQRGASTVAAFSVRARPGLPVSVPIAHEELETLRGADQWTVLTLEERLAALEGDPWEGYAKRQRITREMRSRLLAT